MQPFARGLGAENNNSRAGRLLHEYGEKNLV
jgi:hypothetical protein